MTRRTRRGTGAAGEAGFTVLEVMVALTILAIGLLGIIKLQVQSGLGNLHSRNITGAVNLCRSKIEEIRRVKEYYVPEKGAAVVDAGQLRDTNGSVNLDDWATPDHQVPYTLREDGQPGEVYTLAWNIADSTPEAGMKTVRLRVVWREGNRDHVVTMTTQVALKNLDYYQ